MRKIAAILCVFLLLPMTACGKKESKTIPYWKADSPAMASIVSFVESVTDEKSASFVPENERIAVLDMDGTLYGELFPT